MEEGGIHLPRSSIKYIVKAFKIKEGEIYFVTGKLSVQLGC